MCKLNELFSYIKHNHDRIHRIVVDESHQALVSSDFRPKLKAIDNLREVPLPKIYLSATLPPDNIDDFIKHVGIESRSVKIIRAHTGRKELRYHNVSCRNSLAVHTFVQNLVLQSYLSGIVQADSRVIIFCSTVADAVATSDALGCLQYSSQLNQEERSEAQHTWMEGSSSATRCIAATSAFVHGIDAPFVDLIVFLNPPYGAIDFVQASARGGRRGRAAMVVLAHHGSTLKVNEPDYALRTVMNNYVINQRQCRRLLLNKAMDGTDLKCDTLNGDQLCDICHPDTEVTRLLKQCALMGTMPEQGCLKSIAEPPKKVETEEDEDAFMYDGFDDSEIAAMSLPSSSEVRQVSSRYDMAI